GRSPGAVVLVRADGRPGARLKPPPRRPVTIGEVGGDAVRPVHVVAGGEDRAGDAVEQGGGRLVPLSVAARDVARADEHRTGRRQGRGARPGRARAGRVLGAGEAGEAERAGDDRAKRRHRVRAGLPVILVKVRADRVQAGTASRDHPDEGRLPRRVDSVGALPHQPARQGAAVTPAPPSPPSPAGRARSPAHLRCFRTTRTRCRRFALSSPARSASPASPAPRTLPARARPGRAPRPWRRPVRCSSARATSRAATDRGTRRPPPCSTASPARSSPPATTCTGRRASPPTSPIVTGRRGGGLRRAPGRPS